MKKRILFILCVLILTTVGCSNGQELISYDHNELSKELKKEGIEVKVPTQFPMVVENYEIQLPPHESIWG
ncbi:hypothetical protein HF072_04010 [Bacillus sp. RO3]|nr:hypothetical protein [Bacillus sp. RO3]